MIVDLISFPVVNIFQFINVQIACRYSIKPSYFGYISLTVCNKQLYHKNTIVQDLPDIRMCQVQLDISYIQLATRLLIVWYMVHQHHQL